MSNQNVSTPMFDRSAVRVNQGTIVLLIAVAFLLNLPVLVLFVALVLTLGTAVPSLALFQRLYRDVLRPAGLIKPDVHAEDAAPHRFAQGLGATFLLISSLALFGGAASIGWALALIVLALAAVNLLFGFCAGCFIYFQLHRFQRSE
ncbi:MAG TPA: DUF4395 domain-containing protein [Roseiflexaceae bacterium]|nr:DUF4395 domain-containing protein [Roseiflexaceae bacterium]HMP39744.1 DUF4395 domain-containing protein [Roseiflexaceae bacterium]